MPELPEVETIRRGLNKHIRQQRIQRVSIYSPTLRYPINLKPQQLKNQKIIAIHRRSKYLIFELSQHQLICHLGMSGRIWLVNNSSTKRNKHDHVDIQLGQHCLRYHDPRRFGSLLMVDDAKQHPLLKNLGPEPLSSAFNSRYLQHALVKRSISIKQAIMNNHIVVGVGNIYANEALFRASLHPAIPSNTLTPQQIASLVAAIKTTLKSAIKAGGTTLKDFTNIQARPGYFNQELMVYGRDKETCLRCNSLIVSFSQHGRRSFYCPSCQRDNAA